jgi:hypothetical protein
MPNQRTLDVFFEDYTVLPIGHTIPKGTAAECPYCKRVGLVENRGDKTFYFHRLGLKLIANEDIPEVIDETCPTSGDVKRR